MSMLLKSAILLIVAFLIGRWIGYLLSQARKAKAPEPRAWALAKTLEDDTPQPFAVAAPDPMPVADDIAEPLTETPVAAATVARPAAARPRPKPEPEVASKARAARSRATAPVLVSPLAAMTVAEVEAAIASAGPPAEPMRLKGADGGKPDPLLDIIGIGPVNEVQLHALGIYHFRQIAAWTPENIKWVSERIKFPTRIVRENWMKQAAAFEAEKHG